MKKLWKQLTVYAFCASLVACGGGGSDMPSTSNPAQVAPGDTQASADPSTESNNPSIAGAPSNDARRLRESEGKYKAVPPTVVAQEFKGTDPNAGRAKALAVNDPIQLPMGATAAIAPVPAQADIPANAGQTGQGMWGKVYDWPLIPIHFAQMPDGRIMSYGTNEGGRQTGKTIYDIFDPKDGLFNGHMTIPKNTLADIFCSATLFLPITNQMLTVGGDNLIPDASSPPGFTNNTGNNSSTIFTPSTNTMVAGKNMALPRWYATTTTLANGTTFIQGGLGGEAYPELRQANGNFKSLTTANTSNLDYWYPRNWLAPNGKIFGYDVYGNYYYIATTGTGTLQIINQWDVDSFGEAGSATMYAPGKVLNIAAFSKKVSIVDFSGAGQNPTYTPTDPLPVVRQNGNLVTLPNGKVLVAGGSSVYNSTPAEDPTAIVSYDVMTWDPATGHWTQGPTDPAKIPRLYHSIGVLQADGSVVIGGGGAYGPVSNTNISFYYPDYLFNANGTWATKPTIVDAPTQMDYGKTIKLTVDDTASGPITRITMTKTFAQTHSLNMESNFNDLPFTRSGNVLTVTLPTAAEVWKATPGYYMIFAQTAKGTPAQARIIRMNVPNADVAAPTNATATLAGTTVTVKWTQSATAGVTRNILSRGTSATGPFTDIADIAAATTFALANQPVGTYFYGVKAVVGTTGNVSPISNVVQVGGGNPPTQVVPTAVQGVNATYATASGVTINWTNPTATATMPAVTSVRIARGTAAAGPFTTIATLGAVQTYTDALQTAGTYYYTVTPINSVGAGPATTSNAVTISTTPPVTVNPPTNFTGYTCGAGCWTTDTGVRVNWTLSTTAGVTAQTVQRATAAAGPFTTVATLNGSTAVYVDKNVTNGTTYYYQVAATVGTSTSAFGKLAYGITSNITLGSQAAPTKAVIVANPATGAQVGQAIGLSGSTSVPANGASIVAYEWSITANTAGATFVGAINAVTATVNTTAAGSFTANLKVTDNQGGVATTPLTITVVAAPQGGAFSIVSQEQTKYLVMNWWRGDPAKEGDFRQPGICTGAASQGGNCFLGARKTMRPQAFNIATAANNPAAVTGLIMMDAPQFENGVFSYAHYRLPIEFIKTGCSLKIQHVRTHSNLEFGLNPPGLEILDHKINLTQALCDSYPAGAMTQAWLNTLNTALTAYLGAKVAYNPEPYPYNDPRTHNDPSQ